MQQGLMSPNILPLPTLACLLVSYNKCSRTSTCRIHAACGKAFSLAACLLQSLLLRHHPASHEYMRCCRRPKGWLSTPERSAPGMLSPANSRSVRRRYLLPSIACEDCITSRALSRLLTSISGSLRRLLQNTALHAHKVR